jgi:ribonuclease HI
VPDPSTEILLEIEPEPTKTEPQLSEVDRIVKELLATTPNIEVGMKDSKVLRREGFAGPVTGGTTEEKDLSLPSKIVGEESIIADMREATAVGDTGAKLVGNKVLYGRTYAGFVANGRYITGRNPKTYFWSHKSFNISVAIIEAIKEKIPNGVLIVFNGEDMKQIPYPFTLKEVLESEVLVGRDSKGREDKQYVLDAKIPKVPEKTSDTMNLEEMMRDAEKDTSLIEIVVEKMNVWIDGSGTLLPGQRARYCVLFEGDRPIVEEFDAGTGNEMEYRALLRALEDFRSECATIYSDSQLVVFQLSQKFSISAENLKPLYEKCKSLLDARKATLVWVRREENRAGKVLEK